jgi:gliding motility-associated lipoprotein GldJ
MFKNNFIILVISLSLFSCSKQKSSTTGWNLNDPLNGGFEVVSQEQITGPGLVFIEGGRFTMGMSPQPGTLDHDQNMRNVSLSSFYIDQTEVSNQSYLEYLFWVYRVFEETNPEIYDAALPDTNVWRSEVDFNEQYVNTYFRHPAFANYPVVGVSWRQATEFCAWRTDRVNEQILIDYGYIKHSPKQKADDNFSTESYMAGLYKPSNDKLRPNLAQGSETRNIRWEDGILLPPYRLPTEAEWEYAAFGHIGNSIAENVVEYRNYPWNGNQLRFPYGKKQGVMLANYRRDKGDYMGVAGRLNDNAAPMGPVNAYWPNDFGLYNMAGNVNEWIADEYRSAIPEESEEYNGAFGHDLLLTKRDVESRQFSKDSTGRIIKVRDPKRYAIPGPLDLIAGDEEPGSNGVLESSDAAANESGEANTDESNEFGGSGVDEFGSSAENIDVDRSSMLNARRRVYKGGSWKDMPHWLNPSTRRYLDEDMSRSDIGFRCAMTRMGAPR